MSSRIHFVSLLFAALIATIGGAYFAHYQFSPKAPDNNITKSLAISFPQANGEKHIALSDFSGKILVINFWAPWCPPCVEEIPDLVALQNEFKGKNVQFLGIGIDSAANIHQFERKTPVNYPLLIANIEGLNLAKSLGNQAGVLPFTVIISTNGKVLMQKEGRISKDSIRSILSAPHL